jgi:HAMP domain-containing protein
MKSDDARKKVFFFRRISIRTKVVFMIVIMSAIFGSGILGFIYYQLQNTLREEALNKTLILADGLSVKAAEPVQVEDLNALQFILGEAIGQADVAYAFIRDPRGRVLSSSFEGNVVPAELENINQLEPNVPFGTENANLMLKDTVIEVTDIASPVGGGALGSIHIGLNVSQIKLNIRNILLNILYVGAGGLLLLALLTIVIVAIIIAPVRELMEVSEALGRGDLTKKANVKSSDELGQLGLTLNTTIDRLQGLVQTESDRDKMQHQVMDLLSIVSGAAEGDLTVKAEVTADALGSVADAFNLMINGLQALVSQASDVASEIQHSTTDILKADSRDPGSIGRGERDVPYDPAHGGERRGCHPGIPPGHPGRREGRHVRGRDDQGYAADPRCGADHGKEDQRTWRALSRDRRYHRGDQRDRHPDEFAGLERRDRSCPRRRAGQGLCRGCRRSPEAG